MISPITPERVWTEDIFSLMGLSDMSAEEKEGILLKMNDTVMARVYLAIHEQLSEEDKKKLDEMPAEEVNDFLREHGFDLASMVLDEALRYRLEIVRMFQLATTPLNKQVAA